MGFSSQAGYFLLRTQTARDVYPADMAAAGIILRRRGGSLAANRDLLIVDPEIGGGRDIGDAYLGAASWSGDIEFYTRLKSFPTLLRAALGTLVTTAPGAGDTTATHVFTPSDAAALPFLGIEERIGSGLVTYSYTNAVVNTLHLEADANDYLMGTAGMIATKQLANVTPSVNPAEDASPLYVGTNIVLTYGGVQLPAKSFSLDINNNFEDDDFRLGSFYLGDLVPKRREVTAGFTIRPENANLWKQATYGTAGASEVGGVTTKSPLVIDIASYENIPGSVPAVKYSCKFELPSVILTPFAYEPSGDDIIENDIEVQAVRPSLATPIITATVKTDKALVA